MKNKLLAVMATFGMVASASAVKVNNNLSISGFIDGSYVLTDRDVAAANDTGLDSQDDQTLGLDEVEINFNINVGNVSGLVAIDTDAAEDEDADKASDTLFNIEQAHFTYNVNDAISVTFGRYGSALGLEGEDPAGLYTFSRAYSDASGFNFANVDAGSVDGVTVAYSGNAYSIAASFEEAAGTDLEVNDLNLELSFSYTGIAGVNIGGGYFFDNANGAETDSLNLYATRQFGKLLIGGEYSERSTSEAGKSDIDNDAYILLADYDVNDKLGVALRFSNNEQGAKDDYEKVTIAPNYAITDSLGAIVEYSDIEDNNVDSTVLAVELTYTF